MNKKTNIGNLSGNILIIRLSSIGDIVLTSPVVRVIKNNFKDIKLYFLTFEQFYDTIRFNPRIDSKIILNKSELKQNTQDYFFQCCNELKNVNFDLVIDLQNNRYSRILLKQLKFKNLFKLNKQRLHKLSLVYLKTPIIRNFNVVDNYFASFANDLGIKKDEKGLEFWLEGERGYLASKKSLNKENLTISLVPGAAHNTKKWPTEYFIELINLILQKYGESARIQILGSSNENEIGNKITSQFGDRIINYIAKTTLLQTAELIDNSDLLITNDTGLMHIAAARQTPVVVVFGSSVRELGFVPYNVPHRVVEKKIWCRPCSHIGRSFCPLLHHKCMREIKPIEVFDQCVDLLNQQQNQKISNI